jgi:hypothetical protein
MIIIRNVITKTMHKLKWKNMKFNIYAYGLCVTHKRAVSVNSKRRVCNEKFSAPPYRSFRKSLKKTFRKCAAIIHWLTTILNNCLHISQRSIFLHLLLMPQFSTVLISPKSRYRRRLSWIFLLQTLQLCSGYTYMIRILDCIVVLQFFKKTSNSASTLIETWRII